MLLLTLIITILIAITPTLESKKLHAKSKPFLWVYWDNIVSPSMPGYISLCRKTLMKHCHKSFEIIELNKDNICEFLPEFRNIFQMPRFMRLLIAQKVDIYRILLLAKYGGIYVDSDIIILKNLIDVFNKTNLYDYVGGGAFNERIDDRSSPQNWLMASKPNGKLITKLSEKALKLILSQRSLTYHSFGKSLIREALVDIPDKNYNFYHYPSELFGIRDIHGNFVDTSRIFGSDRIIYEYENDVILIPLYNRVVSNRLKATFNKSEEELLSDQTNFSYWVKKSLGIQE